MNYQLPVTNYQLQPLYAWSLLAVVSVAILSMFVSLQVGIFALFAAIIAWWAASNPPSAFLLLLVVSPLLPLFKATQTISTVTLIKDVIILTLFVRLFLIPLVARQLPYRRNILFAPFLALAAWTCISAIRADSLILGALRARDIALYALVYLAALYLPLTKKFWRQAAGWLFASYVVVAILAVYQWFFAGDSAVLRFDPVRSIWIPRISSTFAHPSVFGQYLIIVASLCLPLALLKIGRARTLAILGWLSTLPLIYLTYSRAVWLGYAAGTGAALLAYYTGSWMNQTAKKIRWQVATPAALATLGLLILLILYTPVGVFIRSALDPTYKSNATRLEFLARLIAPMTNTDAIIGRGLGDVIAQNFRQVDVSTVDIATSSGRNIQLAKDATLVDNQFLKTFVEMGLVGILMYIWLYWRLLKQSFALSRSSPANRIIGLFGIAFVTSFILQALFIDIWDIFPTNLAFWIIAAVISTAEQVKDNITPNVPI